MIFAGKNGVKMSNRGKRVKLAKRLKELGMGKLYSGNKKVAWRLISSGQLNSMLRKLQYAPGDICHDCDGFNHVVVKWLPSIRDFTYWSYSGSYIKGWVIDVDQFEKQNGGWSCGCETSPDPPVSREYIEQYIKKYLNDPKLNEQGWVTNEGLDKKRREALNNGEHICDERGILLEEYK